MHKLFENIVEKTKQAYQQAKQKAIVGIAIPLFIGATSCNPNSVDLPAYDIELANGTHVTASYELSDRGWFGYVETTTLNDGSENLTLEKRKGLVGKPKEKIIHEEGRKKIVYFNDVINNNLVERIKADGETYEYDQKGLGDLFRERTAFYDHAKRDLLYAQREVRDQHAVSTAKQLREGLESALGYD